MQPNGGPGDVKPSGPRERIGSLDELQAKGYLAGKVGSTPVCVFMCDGKAYAVDDRCPHMGFPLHRGTVENGLLTCHWHHARFDLVSGGTLDPFADDVRAHGVEVDGREVVVVLRPDADPAARHLRRLEEGLEQGLTLVMAKAVLGLTEVLGPGPAAVEAIRAGVVFGVRNREAGWGAGLTVLTAMANVLPRLDPDDRALALVHGLAFVSRDTRGRPPRFPLAPLDAAVPDDRLLSWYRRFVETRNGDASERVLATATRQGAKAEEMAALMGAAATDHLFLDGGHTIDFTNKAFEVLDHLGWEHAGEVLPTLAHGTARAGRAEETGEWRHPDDIAVLLKDVQERPADGWDGQAGTGAAAARPTEAVDTLAWAVLGDKPADILAALDKSAQVGATAEELARAVAYAAALRLTRFHVQNDHGDWDVVHHGFTTANAVHQMVRRNPTPELARAIYQGAMKVFLDRFLNVPAARLPGAASTGRAARTWPNSVAASTRKEWSTRPGPLFMAGSSPAATPPRWSGLLAPPSWPRMPSSTGSRPMRRRCARLTHGLRVQNRWRSSWPARLASWLPTPRPGGSWPKWCVSPPGSAAARHFTRKSESQAATNYRVFPFGCPPDGHRRPRTRVAAVTTGAS